MPGRCPATWAPARAVADDGARRALSYAARSAAFCDGVPSVRGPPNPQVRKPGSSSRRERSTGRGAWSGCTGDRRAGGPGPGDGVEVEDRGVLVELPCRFGGGVVCAMSNHARSGARQVRSRHCRAAVRVLVSAAIASRPPCSISSVTRIHQRAYGWVSATCSIAAANRWSSFSSRTSERSPRASIAASKASSRSLKRWSLKVFTEVLLFSYAGIDVDQCHRSF
jgi:hypothetical protein